MTTTPGFLRGTAVAAIIGAIHNAHVAGPWALESAETHGNTGDQTTILTFAVGVVYPDTKDERERITISIDDAESAQ